MDAQPVASDGAEERSRQCADPVIGTAVWVVGSDPVLSAGIAAGLRAAGWDAELAPPGVRPLPDHPRAGAMVNLVLVADREGHVPDLAELGGVPPVVVAVGDRSCAASLMRALQHGAMVAVDTGQPLVALIRSIERWLVNPPSRGLVTEQVATLREQDRAAALFTGLSRREQDVLGALVLGLSAAEIAAERHLSIATVRTHIRAILTRLGVSSQVAAVALTHRYCREPRVVLDLDRLHRF